METTKKNMDETHINSILAASKYSLSNKRALKKDSRCGCYFCLNIFSPKEITDWIPFEDTALCPYCGIDSVIGESSGAPLTKGFLKEMKAYLFWED